MTPLARNLTAFLIIAGVIYGISSLRSVGQRFSEITLIVDGLDCDSIAWDTGYGFNELQTLKCSDIERTKGSKFVPLKDFTRWMDVRSVRVNGGTADLMALHQDRHLILTPGKVSGAEGGQPVRVYHFPRGPWKESRPPFGVLLHLIGVLFFSVLAFWIYRESQYYLSAPSRRFLFVGGLLLNVFVLYIAWPGAASPYDASGAIQLFGSYRPPETLLVDAYYWMVGATAEAGGHPWTPILFLSGFSFATALYCSRKLIESGLRFGWICGLLILFSPVVQIYNVFLAQNIFNAWMSVLLLVRGFFYLRRPSEESLPLLAALGFFTFVFNTNYVLLFPFFTLAWFIWERQIKALLVAGMYAVAVAIFTVATTYFADIEAESVTDQRIKLLHYVTDLQYSCEFPHDFFSPETRAAVGLEAVRAGARTCVERPHLWQLPQTYSVADAWREVGRAWLAYPDLVFGERVRVFFGILGSARVGSSFWDGSHPEFTNALVLDLGLKRQSEGWRRSVFQWWAAWTRFPYAQNYFSLMLVMAILILQRWRYTLVVTVAFLSKLLVVFFFAPNHNFFYLFDLYLVGLIWPFMMILEERELGNGRAALAEAQAR